MPAAACRHAGHGLSACRSRLVDMPAATVDMPAATCRHAGRDVSACRPRLVDMPAEGHAGSGLCPGASGSEIPARGPARAALHVKPPFPWAFSVLESAFFVLESAVSVLERALSKMEHTSWGVLFFTRSVRGSVLERALGNGCFVYSGGLVASGQEAGTNVA